MIKILMTVYGITAEQAAARLKELKENPESVKEWDVTPTQ